MNKKGSIRMGPGASSLILIFVMLSLSVLAMLALAGANNNLQMGRRSVEITEEIYNLYDQAEQTRQQVGALLAKSREGAKTQNEYLQNTAKNLAEWQTAGEQAMPQMRIEDGSLCWEEGDGVYTLDCAVSMGMSDTAGEEDTDRSGEVRAGEWTRHNLLVDRAQMEDDWDAWS